MTSLKPRDIALIALFAALTAVGAFISIPVPFSPAPITFQVLFVLMAGLVLGKYKGMMSQITYVLLGVIGLPVFAGGTSGLGVLFGPTGGYILGFIVAAFVVGWLAEIYGEKNMIFNIVASVTGILVIYLLGTIQLKFILHLGIKQAVLAGVAPFILIDLVKAALASFVAITLAKVGFVQLEH